VITKLRSILKNPELIDPILIATIIFVTIFLRNATSFAILSLVCTGIAILVFFASACPRAYTRYLSAAMAMIATSFVRLIPTYTNDAKTIKEIATLLIVLSSVLSITIPTCNKTMQHFVEVQRQ